MRTNPGLSIKLSALHPRYEMSKADECVPALADRVLELARAARDARIGLNIDAEEAYRLGMVVQVVPPDQLMDAAMADARLIAAKIPQGIRLAKEALGLIENMDVKNGYRFEQTRTAILSKTEDAAEARKAFVEKRPPLFKGR